VARTPVLYDADCGFCRLSMGAVLAWDRRRRLRPVALQDPEADTLLAGMDRERRMASWHLVDDGGAVVSAGPAAGPLLRRLPGGRWPAALLARFPKATNHAYELVSEHRSALGRLVPHALARRADAVIARRRD
jgi:predicted DCC family thiol-disulfide oxidoreductase YuxK